MLEVKKVSVGYNSTEVLRDIDFKVSSKDFLGIIGPNGSGKTTLLRVISKVLRPWSGEVIFQGKNISQIANPEIARQMAVVGQGRQDPIFPLSVKEFVLLGRTPYLRRFQLMESERDLKIVQEVMGLTDTLGLEERCIEDLSGGERQRVVIAQALAQEPQFLLLDEPTAHLDIGHQIEVLDLIKRLNEGENLTVLMVSHDLNLAADYCNRLILLKQGRIFQEGSPREILTYQNIEEVYETLVVVKENPISSNPHVFLVPGRKKMR